MTDYNPPTQDLPIFDKLVFLSGEEYITQNQADKRYLRFPNAQGTENLQTINVNGIATFNNEIVQANAKRITQAVATDNTLPNTLRPTNIYGDLNLLRPTGSNGGSLRLWDVTSSSSGKSFQLFDSGNTASIVNLNNTGAINLNVRDGAGITQDSISCSYSQVAVNANLIMNNASSLDRQISTGYINLNPITGSPGGTGSQLYQSNATSYWDNNTNGGTITFATNTVGGTQVIIMNMTPTYVDTNLPFKINILGNFLQFPDGTQQFTAYTGAIPNKTYSVEYTSTQSITIPANCVGISVSLVGQGGQAGSNADTGVGTTWNSGGSGGGASMILSQTRIPITSGSLSLTISNVTGNPNFLTYNGIEICRAYNGYNGSNATVGAGGAGGVAQTQGLGNTSISTWFLVSGSVGTVGNANITFQNCAGVPTTAGKPNNILTTGTGNDTVRGCGQRYFAIGATNQCPTSTPFQTGCLTVTYYLK